MAVYILRAITCLLLHLVDRLRFQRLQDNFNSGPPADATEDVMQQFARANIITLNGNGCLLISQEMKFGFLHCLYYMILG